MPSIDINEDIGESFGNWRLVNDRDIFPHISSANIAAGFHASDPVTMVESVKLAKEHGVAPGVHPGLPDLLGFGRRKIELTPEDVYAYIVYQIGAVREMLSIQGLELHHVKLHGAMYFSVHANDECVDAAVDGVADAGEDLWVYYPPCEFLKRAAKRGLKTAREFYPDLDYGPDAFPIIQRRKRATDPEKAKRRIRRLLDDGKVQDVNGDLHPFEAETICLHSDDPNAVPVVRAVREGIKESGYDVAPPRS